MNVQFWQKLLGINYEEFVLKRKKDLGYTLIITK